MVTSEVLEHCLCTLEQSTNTLNAQIGPCNELATYPVLYPALTHMQLVEAPATSQEKITVKEKSSPSFLNVFILPRCLCVKKKYYTKIQVHLLIFSFSHHHWFPMPQQQPCSALVPLTIVSMYSNHSWSSGRASRVKKSLSPPASFFAHTQHPPHQTWVLSSCVNMSRYGIAVNIVCL